MTDQVTDPAPEPTQDVEVQDTPVSSPADTDTQQQAVTDFEKRYRDLQPEYTRTTQELSQLKAILSGDDPEGLKNALTQLGYELDEEDDGVEVPGQHQSTAEPHDPRVDELAEWKQQQEALQAADQYRRDLEGEVGERDLPEIGRQFIQDETMRNGADRDALKAAVEKWFGYVDSLAGPKQKPKAPHVPSGGSAPEGKPLSEMSDQERVAHMTARLQAEQA